MYSSAITISQLNRASFPTRWTSHFASTHRYGERLIGGLGVSCSYTGGGISQDSGSATIDVAADVKSELIVVLGGSGFVGSKGIEVVSLSRSGRPSLTDAWTDQVIWVPRDVFYANRDEVLLGATAVVSTIGGFGSEEQMIRMNGEANVVAVNAPSEIGVPKFILISVHDYILPPFLLQSGYFSGKRKAESEVLPKYPTSGNLYALAEISFPNIQPLGKRRVDGFEIPLDLTGEPVEKILSATERFMKPLSSLPGSDLLLAPPVSVDDLAFEVISAVRDDDFFGIFTIEQIKEAAAQVRV